MKVYTKTGDKGTTSLIGGERVAKCDCRVEAYGTVDELTAFTALLADKLQSDEAYTAEVSFLRRIESQLMTVAALLAVGEGGEDKVGKLQSATIEEMEQAIDSMQEALPQITRFTIPGGDERVSLSHVCRTICRRAERQALRAQESCKVEEQVIMYLNRLSDYFYLLGRTITHRSQVEEILWIP